MPYDMIDQPGDLTPDEQEAAATAQQYKPGELAAAIITTARIWKPDDIKNVDATITQTLTELVNRCSVTDEAARRFSILQCWQERHFDRGYQYLTDASNGGWSIFGTENSSKKHNTLKDADDANLYPTNIYSAQGDIITSALCRGQIKVNFNPAKSKNPEDVKAADEANKYKYIWSKVNNSIELQRETVGLAWTDPRAVFWTRSVADRSRWGTVDGADDPRIVEVTTAHGVLETKLPMMADRLDQCGYAQIFEEVDYSVARATYWWMGSKIKPSWGTYGELEFERIARINTRIGIVGKYITGTSGIREATMGYMWFRPGMFYDDQITEEQREWLLSNFPDGLFLIMAGPELVCCWNESMDDHLSLGMFTRGFGQNRRALGSSDISIQKRINIWADLWDKFVRGAIPMGLMDSDAFDAEAMSNLEASTTRFVPVAVPEGRAMTDLVGQTPAPTPVAGFQEIFQWYVGPLMQSIDGATPALFGQGEGEDNTVGATQIRLQQALERVGTAWIVTNGMFAKANCQAARCCAENGNTEIASTISGMGDVLISPQNLKGNFECEAETVNAIPENGAQREAKVLQILDMANQNPQVAALVATPSNAREIVKALHIDDVITIDEANSEDLALENIEILLDSEPLINPQYQQMSAQLEQLTQLHESAKALAIQTTQAGNPPHPDEIQQGGQLEQQVQQLEQQLKQTPQYLPSVEVPEDESIDYATIEATVFAWMQESDGRSLQRKSRVEPEGVGPNWKKWTNVKLYWAANKAMAAQKAAQNVQPIPPKITISVPADKFSGDTQSQVLSKAGIQVTGQDQTPQESETEVIQRTPYSEIKQRTKRRL